MSKQGRRHIDIYSSDDGHAHRVTISALIRANGKLALGCLYSWRTQDGRPCSDVTVSASLTREEATRFRDWLTTWLEEGA